MLSMLGKTVSRRHFEFFYFSKKTGFDILCKLSLKETIIICMKCWALTFHANWETICMNCQSLFPGKSKNVSSSAKFESGKG